MNWQLWFEGLAMAVMNGGAMGAVQAMQNGGQINKGTGVSAAVGALLGLLSYLKTPAVMPPNPPSASGPK